MDRKSFLITGLKSAIMVYSIPGLIFTPVKKVDKQIEISIIKEIVRKINQNTFSIFPAPFVRTTLIVE